MNFKKFITGTAVVMCALTMTLFTGCQNTKDNTEDEKTEIFQASDSFFAMDTYMSITAYGDEENATNAVKAAREEIERLDDLLSTGEEESEISKLNKSGSESISDDALYLIKEALDIYKETNGKFDISIYPVMKVWGFTDGNYKVPDEETLKDLLKNVDASKIKINGNIVSLDDGMEIDLGGIAKGYASNRVMEILKQYGIQSAMVNLGGNVQTLGGKTDGSLWRVAIENPDGTQNYLGVVAVKDKAVITSGGYERYFEENGHKYHHIIDTQNGKPAENGLTSVSIVSADGTLSDALSTSLFIMGEENAINYWRNSEKNFDFILYTYDERVVISEGLKDVFTSDQYVQVVDK